MHSRLLLISTSKSISEIGNECTFPNTSHFIKLFKKEYQMTPATYRHRHQNSQTDEVTAAAGERSPCRKRLRKAARNVNQKLTNRKEIKKS